MGGENDNKENTIHTEITEEVSKSCNGTVD